MPGHRADATQLERALVNWKVALRERQDVPQKIKKLKKEKTAMNTTKPQNLV